MDDVDLLKLMFHHIANPDEPLSLRAARLEFIESAMKKVDGRSTAFVADIRIDQAITYYVGECGQGSEHRYVETGFDVKVGDRLIVYRNP